eukprot:SAG22_NODE_3562_length_1640_cov_2.134328_4_plen_84_part_00
MGPPRLLQSYAWYPVMAAIKALSTAGYEEAMRQKDFPGMFLPLPTPALHQALMTGMATRRPEDGSTCEEQGTVFLLCFHCISV